MDINRYYWEAEQPVAGQTPTSDPMQGAAVGQPMGPPPDQGNPNNPLMSSKPPQNQQGLADGEEDQNITDEPQLPEMPEEQEEPQDFNEWRQEFLKIAAKGDTMEMLNSLQQMRDSDNLEAPQRKFVEDNWQIIILRQNANVEKASKEIRKLIKQSLDRNSPGASVMQAITGVIEESDTPMIKDVFIKLTGLYGMKTDLHRKYLAALTGSVQVGGGGSTEDIAYSEREFSIRMSTRFHTQFGEIIIGKWNLSQDDPDRYLEEPELERLAEGSPEEKQVLRRRIVIESIAEEFRDRAFLIHVISPDGTMYAIGWDMAESLLGGYKDGALIVRSRAGSDSEAMIDNNGAIVPLLDLNIFYLRQTGETDDLGRPRNREVPFMERRDGTLYLSASLETLRDVFNGSMSGCFFKEMAYAGNPSDIKQIVRAVPNIEEILMRRIQ